MVMQAYQLGPAIWTDRQYYARGVDGTGSNEHVPNNESGEARQLRWYQLGDRRLNGRKGAPELLMAQLWTQLQQRGVPNHGLPIIFWR